MRDFYEPSLLRRQLLWGLVGGLLAMTAVPLTVIWLNSLSVMPGDPLLVRASVLEATGWPWQVLLAVELALGFGFGVTVGLAVPPVLRLLEQSSDIPVLTGLLYPYVLLPFFCSMAVTNDVALITFAPFALLLLDQMDCRAAAVPLLVLQTIAANLGSMATPVGNPQNLYLYGAYGLSAGDFFPVVLPLAGISLACLTAAALPVLPRDLQIPPVHPQPLRQPGKLALYGALFLLCLLTVFRILPYGLLTVLVLGTLAAVEPALLRKLDVSLLCTFICFFVVSGNLGRLPAVHGFLQSLLERSTLLTGVLTSQIISNVPAAVLLSGFTDNWRELLLGVDIGGLGTPVASLASLITLKLYLRSPGARPARYLAVFTAWNAALLAVLLAAVWLTSVGA